MDYAWRLEVPVPARGRRPEEAEGRFRPGLVLVRLPGDGERTDRVLGRVEFDPGEWLAPSVRWVSCRLSGGADARKSPDSAAALDALMDLVGGAIRPSNRAALVRVAQLLLPALDQAVDTLVRKRVVS